MSWSRRRVLAAGAAMGAVAGVGGGAARAGLARPLRARPALARLAPMDMAETAIWGYDGQAPGPELRVRQGERVRVLLENELPQPSTIHWHGIRIDNAMDGVAHLTQAPTQPGETFLYDFVAPDAGTFWYHPHNRTWEQMARGLYGPLIVEEPEPPQVDRDLTLVVDDWRLGDDGAIDEASFGALMDWSHAGRLGNWLTVNGRSRPEIAVKLRERLRLRLINTANSSVLPLRLDGVEGWVIALDGQPIEPQPLGLITLAPSQRADVIVDVTEPEGARLMVVSRGEFLAAVLPVSGEARSERLDAPARLASNPLDTALDLGAALEVDLLMEGGAMGGLRAATIGARAHHESGAAIPAGLLDIRDMAQHGFVWAFNGVAGMDERPLFQAPLGRTVRLRILNQTSWPHAMHFHGHHFRVLSRRPLEGGAMGGGMMMHGSAEIVEYEPQDAWRDTVLVAPGEATEIGFVADNPGDWMLHCHMLEHQAAGMATWFKVG